VSLEDDLMRLFGSERIANVMSRLGMEEGQQLEHKWLNRSIETAQRRVEQQNFSIRKRTLEYDDVMNKQREIIYGFRGGIVGSQNIRDQIYDIFSNLIEDQVEAILVDDSADSVSAFVGWVRSTFPVAVREEEIRAKVSEPASVAEEVFDRVKRAYDLKMASEDPQRAPIMERHVALQVIDSQWQDYLRAMDAMRQGVGLRAYGQQDPLVEYKREAYRMFEELMNGIKQDVASTVFRSTTSVESLRTFMEALPQTLVHDDVSVLARARQNEAAMAEGGARSDGGRGSRRNVPEPLTPFERDRPKVGRNDPCPCGSGKKYKKCCGQ
jgi:preprotein translocase subunit SecA